MATMTTRLARVLLLSGLLWAPGCVLFSKVHPEEKQAVTAAAPFTGPRPVKLVPLWHPSIIEAPDPMRGGAMNPGLAGRLFMYGPNDTLGYFEGTLTLIAHDISPGPNGQPRPPVFLDQWQWPAEVLRVLQKSDMVGEGYTLFCPFQSGALRPGITRVQLQVAFQSPGCQVPLYSDPAPISLGSKINDYVSSNGPTGQLLTSNKPK